MAVCRWIGNALAVADLWTIGLSGTVTSQTYTLKPGSLSVDRAVSYVAGGGDTVATILAGLVTAWNAATAPEFQEMTAVGLPVGGPFTSMTLAGDTAGLTTTVSVNVPGTATFTATHTTSATGPNDFTNANNWESGSAPANSDTIIFDNGSVACLYNLGNALTGLTVYVNEGYSGTIGLPYLHNTTNSNVSYIEFRTRYLNVNGAIFINSSKVTRCNVNLHSSSTTVEVLASGRRPIADSPSVLLKGGGSSTVLSVTNGDVGVAFYLGDTATIPIINQTWDTNQGSDTKIYIGSGATLTTINKTGGILTTNSNVTTLTQGPKGGTTTIQAGGITTLDVQGGTVDVNTTGTVATLKLSNDATVTYDHDPRAKVITNAIQTYGEKWSMIDNQKVINSGVLTVQLNKGVSANIQHGAGSLYVIT